MGKELFETFPEARQTFLRVSEAVGFDVAKLCFDSDEETLRQTQNAQIGLYTASLAAFSVLGASGLAMSHVIAYAGHSVGEYAALAAAGVFSLEDGALLVKKRGEVMAEAGKSAPGTMAAVLGLDRADLEKACEQAAGIVVVANDNCPGQLVISGEVAAVAEAGELAKALGAKRVVPLNVSGAFHSPLMEKPAQEMAQALQKTALTPTAIAVYSNVTSEPILDTSLWPGLLERQLKSPVRWTESVMHLRRDGVTLFVECGWGDVLSGLVRRTDKESRVSKVADLASLEATLATLTELFGEA
jgi:[acyl-carrier-protein] S-malonyltransferase